MASSQERSVLLEHPDLRQNGKRLLPKSLASTIAASK